MAAFEYDEDKSRANKEKHGIDFLEAQSLWKDPYALEIRAISEDEDRVPDHWPNRQQTLVSCRNLSGRTSSSDFSKAIPQEGG